MSGLPSSQTLQWVSILTILWNHSCLNCNNCTWSGLIKNSFHHIFFNLSSSTFKNVKCSMYWKSLTYYKNRWKNFSDECPKCAKSRILDPAALFPICYLHGASCESGYVYPASLTIELFHRFSNIWVHDTWATDYCNSCDKSISWPRATIMAHSMIWLCDLIYHGRKRT